MQLAHEQTDWMRLEPTFRPMSFAGSFWVPAVKTQGQPFAGRKQTTPDS